MWKCGKVGHYSRDCQLENKINSLKISDKLKNLMIGLMIDKENEDSSEDYGSEEDNQILIIQEISVKSQARKKKNQMIKRIVMVFVHAHINQ